MLSLERCVSTGMTNLEWHPPAVEKLYRAPDFGNTSLERLRSFAKTLQSSSELRSYVKHINLLPSRAAPRNGRMAVFRTEDYCNLDAEEQFRSDPVVFRSLFASIQSVSTLKVGR